MGTIEPEAKVDKSVCVIGAGFSGLPAIKACLEEGISVVCYEKRHDLGGLWNFEESAPKNQSTVMRNTILNASKEMMCFSDFPAPGDAPIFMGHRKVLEYMRLYVEHFDLLPYIRFNTEVTLLKKAPDFADTGRWIVKLSTGKEETFDGVILATGHHAKQYSPVFPGQESFTGRVSHAQDYRDCQNLDGKNILVVGIGNSGLDIAVESSRVANKVLHSTRRGAWVFRRTLHWGMPFDAMWLTRAFWNLRHMLPSFMIRRAFEYQADLFMDHDFYGLRPEHHFFAQHVTVNDHYAGCLSNGSVQVRPNIQRFQGDMVTFTNGVEERVDEVIMCTGYDIEFPFLDSGIIDVQAESNSVQLYMHMWPVDLARNDTLAVIGLFQPMGPLTPIAEMQARWAARVFAGRAALPSLADKRAKMAEMEAYQAKWYVKSRRHTVQVDYVPYMNDIAEQIGAEPRLWELAKKDLKLALYGYFGPNVPYLYRLRGPHAKPQLAKEAVMTVMDRMKEPFRLSGRQDMAPRSSTMRFFIWSTLILVLSFWYAWFLDLLKAPSKYYNRAKYMSQAEEFRARQKHVSPAKGLNNNAAMAELNGVGTNGFVTSL